MLSVKVDISEEQIEKIIPHLVSNKIISGICTSDKKQFLSYKEAQKRIQSIAKLAKTQNFSQLAQSAGLDPEGIPLFVQSIENQNTQTKNSKETSK